MPIYLLKGIPGTEKNPAWNATAMDFAGGKVRAQDEIHARLNAGAATSKSSAGQEFGARSTPASPWQNVGLTSCDQIDGDLSIENGHVYANDGMIYDVH